MPDMTDFAQEREAEVRDASIAEHDRWMLAQARKGLRSCCECDDPISDLRRLAGAIRCVEHQIEHEARERVLRGCP